MDGRRWSRQLEIVSRWARALFAVAAILGDWLLRGVTGDLLFRPLPLLGVGTAAALALLLAAGFRKPLAWRRAEDHPLLGSDLAGSLLPSRSRGPGGCWSPQGPGRRFR